MKLFTACFMSLLLASATVADLPYNSNFKRDSEIKPPGINPPDASHTHQPFPTGTGGAKPSDGWHKWDQGPKTFQTGTRPHHHKPTGTGSGSPPPGLRRRKEGDGHHHPPGTGGGVLPPTGTGAYPGPTGGAGTGGKPPPVDWRWPTPPIAS